MYSCDCDDCKTLQLDAKDSNANDFKDVLKAGEKAFKHLLKNGSYKPEDITQKPYQNLINETNKIFKKVVQDNVISPVLRSALESDAFLFGSLKTHAQLFEANALLFNKDGQIKSQAQLEHELNKLNVAYNNNYLEAERQFAVSSAISADKWSKVSDRYNLQYRTVNDDKVRDEHRVLHDITLPPQDEFWKKYYPPNGWRCRCVAVQVRKSKYPESDAAKAMELGDKATMQIGKDGKNRLEIFRFNPGISLKLMPPQHPYNKVKGAEKVKEEVKSKFVPTNLNEYEEKVGVKINREFFSNLGKETPLHFTNPKGSGVSSSGAYFHPTQNFVKIPIDQRRKNSPWYGEAIYYHEYGHAIDWQKGLKNLDSLAQTMQKHRSLIKENLKHYSELSKKLYNAGYDAYMSKNHDVVEMVGAVQDTLKSLDIRIGSGHSDAYFKHKGNSEAEFIAHAFENKFKGNSVFQEHLPELYDDMIKWLEDAL